MKSEKKSKAVNKKKEENIGKLEKEVMDLFGRIKGKFLSLNTGVVAEKLKIEISEARWILGHLVEEGKLVTLTNQDDKVVYLVRKKNGWRYSSEELVNLLKGEFFDTVGQFLMNMLETGTIQLSDKFLEENDEKLKIPSEILAQIISCFEDAGLITISSTKKISYAHKGREVGLGYDRLRNTFLSSQLLNVDLSRAGFPSLKFKNFDELKKIHDRHSQSTTIKRLEIEIPKEEVNIQHFTEILFGHQDVDMVFLDRIVDYLKKLDPKKRPDILVVSGIIQGAFQYKQKNRRVTLVQSLKSENKQFNAAKMFLDELAKLGIKVIYNRGNDDRDVCENRTVDALRIMDSLAKPNEKKAKSSISYYKFDQLKQTRAWDFHFWFQWNVVFEYMLRSGRRLYSADEVAHMHGRPIEEYFMLLETYLALTRGQEIPDPFYSRVLELGNIPLPSLVFPDFIVTDNCNMDIKLSTGKVVKVWDRHNFALTPTTMTQDPTRSARDIMGHVLASGHEAPDFFIIEHQQQSVGVLQGKTLICATPGMHTANLNRTGFASDVSIDSSKRKLMTRREYFQAGSTTVGKTDDDRYLVKFYNKSFLDKATISKERQTIAFLSDWQTGSITARPDIQVKALDYILHKVLPNRPVHMYFAGDIIQGRNYPEMPNENVRMGLIRISDQKDFLRQFILRSIKGVPKKHLKNLLGVDIVPGNHEYNSFHKLTGDTYSDFLANTFEDFFMSLDIPVPVRYHDKLSTQFGEFFNAWVAKNDVAGYGILAQHMIIERGGKGATSMPVYQGKTLLEGTGRLMENVDMVLTGHWHEPRYLMMDNKLIVINGSLAGLSGYEFARGYYPTMGTILMHVGGGEAPELEIITADTLFKHKAQGSFSEEQLGGSGFVGDKDFNPNIHGFLRDNGFPQSAIQKFLWSLVDNINWKSQSRL